MQKLLWKRTVGRVHQGLLGNHFEEMIRYKADRGFGLCPIFAQVTH